MTIATALIAPISLLKWLDAPTTDALFVLIQHFAPYSPSSAASIEAALNGNKNLHPRYTATLLHELHALTVIDD